MSIGQAFPQVLEAARLGSEWAWAELWHDLAGPVTGYMRSKGVKEPDEATAEVFGEVARKIGGFVGLEDQFRSWVFTIAHSRLIDQRRWFARRRVETLSPAFDRADPSADPATMFESASSEARAMAMLTSLTPEQAEVIALRVLADLSLEQVAQITGRNVNAVKQLQHRALRALRKEFPEGK